MWQVEAKGWVAPDDPDEWLPAMREPGTLDNAVLALKANRESDESLGVHYPYRIVEVED